MDKITVEKTMHKIPGNAGRLVAFGLTSGLFCAGAFAQAFTFSSTSETPTTVGATTPQGSVSGAHWTGTTTTTYADGTKGESAFKCVSTSQPPRDSIFMVHGVCDGASEDGNSTVYTGCNFMDAEMTTMSCVGGLIGKTGPLAGRTGTVTIYSKGRTSTGTGQWHE